MQKNYFRRKKSFIDEKDRESIREMNNIKKYAGITFYAGILGLGVAAANSFFSGEPNPKTLLEPINQLSNAQLIENVVFGLSSLGYFVGGTAYGLLTLLRDEEIKHIKEKIKSKLEK